MSKLFVDEIVHQSSQGSGTITLGASGEKVDLGATAGGTFTQRPAFNAYLSADQSITNVTWTKVQCNTETLDTDSAYDNSTNYRFTVPTGMGGKYLVYVRARLNSGGTDRMNECFTGIYKNGGQITQNTFGFGSHQPTRMSPNETNIIDLSAGDYIEFFVYVNATTGTPSAQGNTTLQRTNFGAIRLIGV